jgi:hypothetical protein
MVMPPAAAVAGIEMERVALLDADPDCEPEADAEADVEEDMTSGRGGSRLIGYYR